MALVIEPLAPEVFVCGLVLAVFVPPVFCCEEAAGEAVSCVLAEPDKMQAHSSAAAQLAVKLSLRVTAQRFCSNLKALKSPQSTVRKKQTQPKLAL